MDGVCRFFYVNISRFPESSAKEWVKVNIHFEGGGPGSPAKKIMISNNLSRLGILLWCQLQLYKTVKELSRIIPDNLAWCGRWWMNPHKRSCYSTWVLWKMSMEFTKNSQDRFLSHEDWPFVDKKNLDHQPHIISDVTDLLSLSLYIHIAIFVLWPPGPYVVAGRNAPWTDATSNGAKVAQVDGFLSFWHLLEKSVDERSSNSWK